MGGTLTPQQEQVAYRRGRQQAAQNQQFLSELQSIRAGLEQQRIQSQARTRQAQFEAQETALERQADLRETAVKEMGKTRRQQQEQQFEALTGDVEYYREQLEEREQRMSRRQKARSLMRDIWRDPQLDRPTKQTMVQRLRGREPDYETVRDWYMEQKQSMNAPTDTSEINDRVSLLQDRIDQLDQKISEAQFTDTSENRVNAWKERRQQYQQRVDSILSRTQPMSQTQRRQRSNRSTQRQRRGAQDGMSASPTQEQELQPASNERIRQAARDVKTENPNLGRQEVTQRVEQRLNNQGYTMQR